MSESNYPEVEVVQMAIGLDLIGSKMSLRKGKSMRLEATPVGIRVTSKSSGRTIVIPYANVKGFEMTGEEAQKDIG